MQYYTVMSFLSDTFGDAFVTFIPYAEISL